MHDPLPLMISLSLATPKAVLNQRNASNGQQNSSTEISPVDSKEEAAPKLTLSPETAFTARVKISDQVPFAIPQGEPNVGSTPVPVAAVGPDAAKSAADKVSAVAGRAIESSVAETLSGQPNQAPQAVLTPAANPSAPTAISKEAPSVKTVDTIGEIPATPVGATGPMKEISLQLPGARGVEVKLTETAGQVRVDVRSADSALTQDLRGSLHELVNSLEKKGLSAEVSHPVQAGGVRLNESSASKEANSESNGDATGRHEQERQQQERQRQQNPSFDGRSQKVRATAWNDAIDPHLEKR